MGESFVGFSLSLPVFQIFGGELGQNGAAYEIDESQNPNILSQNRTLFVIIKINLM